MKDLVHAAPGTSLSIMDSMYRLAAAIVLSSVAFGQNPPEPEIARAAKSPYDLARYINSNSDLDWAPLWKALGVDENLGLSCSWDCAAELIVLDNPEQVILVANISLPYDAYLRFRKSSEGEWRVTGKYFANVWNANPHRHGMVRAGDTRFLVVSTHGGHGSGLDEEMEVWFDLSRASFDPVFSYSLRGHEDYMGAGISREIEASARAGSSSEIQLSLTTSLYYSTEGVSLGRFEFVGVYTRNADEGFSLQEAHSRDFSSRIPNQDFIDFARIGGASPEEEIKYALLRLKEIAIGKDDEAKMWLRRVLDRTEDTSEKRALLELVGKP